MEISSDYRDEDVVLIWSIQIDLPSISLSENAEHFFVSIIGQHWEVNSNQRAVQIWDTLEKDPENIFLQDYKPMCQKWRPYPFVIYEYVEYFSECNGVSSKFQLFSFSPFFFKWIS